MQNPNRNAIADGAWVLKSISDYSFCASFDCGDPDLNEYFHKDAAFYKDELLTQSYCLIRSTRPKIVLALLDLCNDSVHVDQYKKEVDLNQDKQKKHLPAVKLTRFGVHREYHRNHIGTYALNLVKKFFITNNRTGCRFLIVDAYKNPDVIKFYEKNEFKQFPINKKDLEKPTRAMFYDLKRLVHT
jgi:GNAT superfamily N-acetyltransferase